MGLEVEQCHSRAYKRIEVSNPKNTRLLCKDLTNIDKSSFFYLLRPFNLVGNFLFPLYRCCLPLFSRFSIPLVGDGLGKQVCKNQLEVGEGAKLEMIKEVGVNSSQLACGVYIPRRDYASPGRRTLFQRALSAAPHFLYVSRSRFLLTGTG